MRLRHTIDRGAAACVPLISSSLFVLFLFLSDAKEWREKKKKRVDVIMRLFEGADLGGVSKVAEAKNG